MRKIALVRAALACVTCLWFSISIVAKHVTLKPVDPLIANGVRFTIPHNEGRRGYVEAWDMETEKKLWERTIYKRAYLPLPFAKAECAHFEYITSATLNGSEIIVTTERNRRFSLNTADRKVRKLKDTAFAAAGSSIKRNSAVEPQEAYPLGTKECPIHGRTLEKGVMFAYRGVNGCEAREYMKCRKCQKTLAKKFGAQHPYAKEEKNITPLPRIRQASN